MVKETAVDIQTRIKRRSEVREKRGLSPDFEPASRGNYPLTTERQFAKQITKSVTTIAELVKEMLIPRLPEMVDEVTLMDTRKDTYVEDFESIMTGIKVQFGQRVTRTDIERASQDMANEVDNINKATFEKQVNQVIGVKPFVSEPWVQTVLTNSVVRNVSLIKSVQDTYFKDIEFFVMDGLEKGLSTREIALNISKRTGIAKRRAQLIARDQVATLNSNLATRRATGLGLKRFRWSTSHDERVRPSHRALDNKIFTYKDGAYVDGESGVLPGEPINCRCVAIPVISSLNETPTESKKKANRENRTKKGKEAKNRKKREAKFQA